jgi:hypothetical protein
MKKTMIFTAAMSIILTMAFSSCDSNKQKTEEAQANVTEATAQLAKAQLKAEEDSMNLANQEEWNTFKNETEEVIKTHEIRIAFLKKSLKENKPLSSKELSTKIAALEAKNKALKSRLDTYEKIKGDWVSFKQEFGHDMDQLGTALKDFTVPNN